MPGAAAQVTQVHNLHAVLTHTLAGQTMQQISEPVQHSVLAPATGATLHPVRLLAVVRNELAFSNAWIIASAIPNST